MDSLEPPLVTTWPVITEAAWLLRNTHDGVASLLRMLENRLIICEELDSDSPAWLRGFLTDYADLSPQLADASLVRIAEKLNTTTIFTLDRRDFVVFRNKDGAPFSLLPAAV